MFSGQYQNLKIRNTYKIERFRVIFGDSAEAMHEWTKNSIEWEENKLPAFQQPVLLLCKN
ncbi:MAG: hypothetical protein A2Y87_13125 [Bacteroidetes bacterium RBG_13_46_8]|nr:MAG: hypothetical protein A2Y87_13125 [Bacteroidetes bacterium RBG_13_46_8]